MSKSAPDQAAFESWLRTQGADVLPTTSPWELARFRAHNSIHIIYTKANGAITAQEFGLQCLAAFRRGASLSMGQTVKRKPLAYKKEALLRRDGSDCFFCGLPMTEEEATIEHLVPLSRRGPNTDENLALAHKTCNLAAGDAPLMHKIRKHCEARIRAALAQSSPQSREKIAI